MINFRGEVVGSDTIARGQSVVNSLSTGEGDAVYFTDDDNLFNGLNT